MMTLRFEDFVSDKPTVAKIKSAGATPEPSSIEGVKTTFLTSGSDSRGSLFELLSTRDGLLEPIVHVYQVHAAPGSIRGWVYHKHQTDRLAYTNGDFRLVLYDTRPESPTNGVLEILDVGAKRRCLVTIPPLVIHGLQNRGDDVATFVNMPTKVYDPEKPDKHRLPADHPDSPYKF